MSASSNEFELAPTQSPDGSPSLVAHHFGPGRGTLEMVPANRWRPWMEEAEWRWPNRCLPLLMANESGWWLLNPHGIAVTWDGNDSGYGVSIEYDERLPESRRLVGSQFGYGIVTWLIPYVFTTDPGWDLLVRGPANLPKDSIAPLEGLVETDWVAPFTMNWKFTRTDTPIRFEAGEPFCMIVPQRRHDLEAIHPHSTTLARNPRLAEGFAAWARRRDELSGRKFVAEFGQIEGFTPTEWQQDYFKGQPSGGIEAPPDHRTKRRLREFEADGGPSATET